MFPTTGGEARESAWEHEDGVSSLTVGAATAEVFPAHPPREGWEVHLEASWMARGDSPMLRAVCLEPLAWEDGPTSLVASWPTKQEAQVAAEAMLRRINRWDADGLTPDQGGEARETVACPDCPTLLPAGDEGPCPGCGARESGRVRE